MSCCGSLHQLQSADRGSILLVKLGSVFPVPISKFSIPEFPQFVFFIVPITIFMSLNSFVPRVVCVFLEF